jgi:hypothetical protein
MNGKISKLFNVTQRKQSYFIVVYNRFIETAVKWLTPERMKLYPVTICVLTFFAWGISIGIGRGLTDASGNIIGADFLTFYTAGKFYLMGRMNELYDIAEQAAFQRRILAPVSFNSVCYFNYPPFTTLFCATFALGSYLNGLILWWGAGLLALALSLHLLRRELMALRVRSTGRLFLMSFLFFPTIAWFLYGQDTALTLLLYTIAFVMLRRENDLAAGLALGLLLYKPQLAIAVGMVLIIKWRWRALIGGLVSVGIWIAIGFAISPLVMKEYLRLIPCLFELQRRHDLVPTWGYHNFYGFAALLFDGFWRRGSDIFASLLMVGGVSVVLFLWRRIDWKPGTRTWDMRLAATLALGLLISAHLYLYDLMLLLLPLVIVWSYYPHGTGDRPLDSGPLLVWTALLYTVCFFSSSISLAQLRLSILAGLPAVALQMSVPITIGWVFVVIRLARKVP